MLTLQSFLKDLEVELTSTQSLILNLLYGQPLSPDETFVLNKLGDKVIYYPNTETDSFVLIANRRQSKTFLLSIIALYELAKLKDNGESGLLLWVSSNKLSFRTIVKLAKTSKVFSEMTYDDDYDAGITINKNLKIRYQGFNSFEIRIANADRVFIDEVDFLDHSYYLHEEKVDKDEILILWEELLMRSRLGWGFQIRYAVGSVENGCLEFLYEKAKTNNNYIALDIRDI